MSLEHHNDPSSAAGGRFATTHWSVVLAAGDVASNRERSALEKLCSAYWYPLYSYIRRQGYDPFTAQDLAQDFFGWLLQSDHLRLADRELGRFRSFLLVRLK